VRLTERLGRAWKHLRADLGGVTTQLPWDDYWYHNLGVTTATGLRISPESALRVAAVFACTRVVSETVASCPAIVYRRLPNGGKERALDHPLYKILHYKPNQWQTAFEWAEMMQAHLELRGNAFSVIVPGPNGAVDSLVPIHPDRVNVYRLPNGKLKYQVRSFYNAEVDNYAQEEMFHLRGMSADGLVGMSTVAVGAETIACGLATQEHAGRFFQNGSTPSGVFTAPKALSDEQYARYKKSIHDAHSGENSHRAMVLEEGMTWQSIGINNKDSQFLEAREFSRSDIASMWRVPPHKIGDLSRATFSNIEQQNIEFATDCIRPRLVRFERRIHNDLIDPLDLGDGYEYFCQFDMDAQLRGDMKSRYDSYAVGRQWGWLSANDICSMENRNPLPAGGDEYLRPLNMVDAGAANPDAADQSVQQEDSTATSTLMLPGKRAQKQLTDGEAKLATARLREFAQSAAERVVRKEVKALTKALEKSDGNGAVLEAVDEFYGTHGAFVSESMCINHAAANLYVQRNRALFFGTESAFALAQIENYSADYLASLALDEKDRPAPAERPIHITMPPQTINLNPSLTVQPMAMKIEQPSATDTKNIEFVRDKDGRVSSMKVGADKKQFDFKRDKSGRVEKVEAK
jgi:HK97 family phage portal protein